MSGGGVERVRTSGSVRGGGGDPSPAPPHPHPTPPPRYITKDLPVKYPMHYVPEVLMSVLSLWGGYLALK